MNETPGEDDVQLVKCDCCGDEFPEDKLIYGVCENCDAMINEEGSW